MVVFVFHDAATTDIYTYLHTLSLHDALPICRRWRRRSARYGRGQSTWKSPWLLSASRVTPLRDTAINICCPANSTTATFDPGRSGSTPTSSIGRRCLSPRPIGTPISTRFHSHRQPHALRTSIGHTTRRRRIYSNIHPPTRTPSDS